MAPEVPADCNQIGAGKCTIFIVEHAGAAIVAVTIPAGGEYPGHRLRELYPQGRFETRRFRPNIVVSTGSEDAGFVENGWIGRTVVVEVDGTVRWSLPNHWRRWAWNRALR